MRLLPSFCRAHSAEREEQRSRLQRQLYLAREAPVPEVDLSHCGLTEVPEGMLIMIKVRCVLGLLVWGIPRSVVGFCRDRGCGAPGNFCLFPSQLNLCLASSRSMRFLFYCLLFNPHIPSYQIVATSLI